MGNDAEKAGKALDHSSLQVKEKGERTWVEESLAALHSKEGLESHHGFRRQS